MKCRKCGMKLNDYLDMFRHNDLEICPRDSQIEYLEQINLMEVKR